MQFGSFSDLFQYMYNFIMAFIREIRAMIGGIRQSNDETTTAPAAESEEEE